MLVFVSLNSELTQGGMPNKAHKKSVATWNERFKLRHIIECQSLGGKARERLFVKSGNSKALVYTGEFRKACTCSGKT